MTKFASQAIVLLKNEGDILPLKPKVRPVCVRVEAVKLTHFCLQEQGLKKIAIVGGNAKAIVLSGGGSAALKPSFFTTPFDGIVQALGKVASDVEITYSEGARGTLLSSSMSPDIANRSVSVHADADAGERHRHRRRP